MTFVFAVVDTRILTQYGAEQASGSFIGDVVVSVASVLVMTVAVLGIIGVVKSSIKIIYLVKCIYNFKKVLFSKNFTAT